MDARMVARQYKSTFLQSWMICLALLSIGLAAANAGAQTPGDVMLDYDTSALRQAVEQGDLDRVKEFVEAGATGDTMDFFNPYEPGAVAIAIERGHRDIAVFLIEEQFQEGHAGSALQAAVAAQDVELLRLALKRYDYGDNGAGPAGGRAAFNSALASPDQARELSSPFFDAGWRLSYDTPAGSELFKAEYAAGNRDFAGRLCEAGFEDGAEMVPAELAAGRYAAAIFLLQHCVQEYQLDSLVSRTYTDMLSARNYQGMAAFYASGLVGVDDEVSYMGPAIQTAITDGDEALLAFLIEQGADLNQRNDYGQLLLALAVEKQHTALAMALLSAGAPYKGGPDNPWAAPVEQALQVRDATVYQALVELGETAEEPAEQMCAQLEGAADLRDLKFCQALGYVGQIEGRLSGALVVAAGRNNLTELRQLLGEGVSPDAVDEDGASALMRAAREGAFEAFEILLAAGADPQLGRNADDLLGQAAIGADLPLYQRAELLASTDEARLEAVDNAVRYERAEILDYQLQAGYPLPPDILQQAMESAPRDIFEQLLAAGADPRGAGLWNRTLWTQLGNLHYRMEDEEYGFYRAKLKELGLDPAELDGQGRNALSAHLNRIEPAQFSRLQPLLDQGLRVPEKSVDEFTELQVELLTAGRGRLFLTLLEAGLSADGADDQGRSLLNIALRGGKQRMVFALLEAGADAQAVEPGTGVSMLQVAVEEELGAAIPALIAAGADVDQRQRGSQGTTPLMVAAALGYEDMVAQLLEAGADAGRFDNQGDTTMDYLAADASDSLRDLLQRAAAGGVEETRIALYVSAIGQSTVAPLDVSSDGKLAIRRAGSVVELWDEVNGRAIRALAADLPVESFLAHENPLLMAQFYTDDQLLLLRDFASAAYLVDAYSGEMLRSFEIPYTDNLRGGLLVAGHGQLLLSSNNQTALLDIATGEQLRSWSVGLEDLNWQEPGRIFTGMRNDDLYTVDLQDEQVAAFNVFTREAFLDPEKAVVNDAGLVLLAQNKQAGVNPGLLLKVDAANGAVLGSLDTGPGELVSLEFLPQGRRVFTVHEREGAQYVALWDVASGQRLLSEKVADSYLDPATAVDAAGHLLWIDEHKNLQRRSAEDGSLLAQVQIPWADMEVSLQPLADGLVAVIGSGQIDVWNIEEARRLASRELGYGVRLSAVVGGKELLLVSLDSDFHYLALPGLESLEHHRPFAPDTAPPRRGEDSCLSGFNRGSLRVLDDGELLYGCYNEGIYRWRRGEAQAERLDSQDAGFLGHALQAFALSPSGQYMVSLHSGDSSLRLWDTSRWQVVQEPILIGDSRPFAAGLAVQGRHALLASEDQRRLQLWDVEAGRAVAEYVAGEEFQYSGASIAAGGELAVTWSVSSVHLWRFPEGELLDIFSVGLGPDVFYAAISPDGNTLAVASGREVFTVQLWDLRSGEKGPLIDGARGMLRHVDFSPDSRQLLVSGDDVTRWDVASGEQLFRYPMKTGWAERAFFVDGGAAVVTSARVPRNYYYRAEFYSQRWPLAGDQPLEEWSGYQLLDHDASGALLFLNASGEVVRRSAAGEQTTWPGLVLDVTTRDDPLLRLSGDNLLQANREIFVEHRAEEASRYFDITSRGSSYDESPLRLIRYSDGRDRALYQNGEYLRVYDTVSEKPLGCIEGRLGEYQRVALSANGKRAFLQQGGGAWLSAELDGAACQLPAAARAPGGSASTIYTAAPTESQDAFAGGLASLAVISEDGRYLAMAEDEMLRVISLETGQLLEPLDTGVFIQGLAISPDGRDVMIFHGDGYLALRNTESGEEYFRERMAGDEPLSIQWDRTASQIEVVTQRVTRLTMQCDQICEEIIEEMERTVERWDYQLGKRLSLASERQAPVPDNQQEELALASGDSLPISYRAGSANLEHFGQDDINAMRSPGGAYWATGLDEDGITIYNHRGELVYEQLQPDAPYEQLLRRVFFLPGERHALVVGRDAQLTLVDLEAGEAVAWVRLFADQRWVVFDPQGRYDSNSPGDLPLVAWVAEDAPLTALPVEVFMREYFEPRLLARIVAGEALAEVTSIADLNRVQAGVEITRVEPVRGEVDRVDVELNVTHTRQQGEAGEVDSGLGELRLFREGQLVAWLPAEDLAAIKPGKTKAQRIARVRLPAGDAGSALNFSAYAFNSDGVKSATASQVYRYPESVASDTRRAYVIVVGMNSYENSSWNLRYAAADARAVLEGMGTSLGAGATYQEVVGIPLLSVPGAEAYPTKARILAVLDKLAGRKVDEAVLAGIPDADQLQPAGPDDLVVFAFAGHGLAGEGGEFYLFPWDLGPGQSRVIDDPFFERLLSSSELDLAMRDIDAGEFLMIIDACNSAASIEGEGFKPGPMGSRGLGQLAYSKGMRVLTASEAEAVALESDALEHGLLTYALIEEGLLQGLADTTPVNRRITSRELLQFGANRVPELHKLVTEGESKLPGERGASIILDPQITQPKVYVQRPALFDFSPRSRNAVIREQASP